MENQYFTTLKEMFPDFDNEIIESILIQSNDNIEVAIEMLFSLGDNQMQSEEILLPQDEELRLTTAEMERIRIDNIQENKRKLELCKQQDKELQRATTESLKQYKKDEKKLKKQRKSHENQDHLAQPKEKNENYMNVDLLELNKESSERENKKIIRNTEKSGELLQINREDSYPENYVDINIDLPKPKPVENQSENINPSEKPKKNNLMTKIKNIFKKDKKKEEDKDLYIEIPSINK